MGASFHPRFFRHSLLRLRRTAAIPGALAPVGLVVVGAWAVLRGWGVAGVVLASGMLLLALAIRLLDLRSAGMRMRASWSLTFVAVMMPRLEALAYIEIHAANLDRTDCPQRRRAIVLNTLKASPQILVTTWNGWLHTQMVRVVAPLMRPRVDRLGRELGSGTPVVFCSPRQLSANRRRWRRLRRHCKVIRFAVGRCQYPELAKAADALASRCGRLAAARVHRNVDESATVLALSLQVNQGVRELSSALANWRSDRGGG